MMLFMMHPDPMTGNQILAVLTQGIGVKNRDHRVKIFYNSFEGVLDKLNDTLEY